MSIQNQRMQTLCEALNLNTLYSYYDNMAQTAAKEQKPYTYYLEELLVEEQNSRKIKGRSMLLKITAFPLIDRNLKIIKKRNSTPLF